MTLNNNDALNVGTHDSGGKGPDRAGGNSLNCYDSKNRNDKKNKTYYQDLNDSDSSRTYDGNDDIIEEDYNEDNNELSPYFVSKSAPTAKVTAPIIHRLEIHGTTRGHTIVGTPKSLRNLRNSALIQTTLHRSLIQSHARRLDVEYRRGDRSAIFSKTSEHTIIAHACNVEGHWGKGFAMHVRHLFPEAFEIYQSYCLSHAQPVRNVGKCMLVCPPRQDVSHKPIIGCLFTNKGIGGRYLSEKAMREAILKATGQSLSALIAGIANAVQKEHIQPVAEIRMPKINSGLFRVPWKDTLQLLLNYRLPPGVESPPKIVVYSIRRSRARYHETRLKSSDRSKLR